MKSNTTYLEFNTKEKVCLMKMTDKVQQAVIDSDVKDGLVLVSPMHITASVIVNDDERGLHEDYMRILEELAPYRARYKHNETGEDNAAAHIWRQLMGHQVVLPITEGRLDLGTWEQVFYFEFDGQRKKRVIIKVIGQ